MSFLHKNIYAYLFSTVLVFGVYFWRMAVMYQDGRFDGADATSLLGQSVLILIAVTILLTLVSSIVFNNLLAIKMCDHGSSYVIDERDRQIELRGMRISEIVTGIGFMLAMAALALGQEPFLVFNIIVFGFASASVAGGVAKLFLYRRGF
jgi:DMSO/TMAO reductase YedYZ heme-binding membrane subunit